MLSPEAFVDEYDDETLRAELPDSPVGSLRDIQYLYGKLYTLATTGGGEYAPYLTPDAASDLIDTDRSLVVVRVDLSGGEPRLADDAVQVTRYTDDLVTKVAHCKYPAARGIDHSITHQAGRNSDPQKLARYAKERLTKWATDEVVQETSADHEDGWRIDDLAALGDDDTAIDRIEAELKRELDGESATALLTVQVSLDGETYLWPGKQDVFLSAMRARKLSKLVTKNKASDSSGEATDIVTGEQTRTVGTADDPQNYFLGKQREKFPGLDIEQAWRSHPISEDSAVTVMNADAFTDACSFYALGAKVFYLPYPFGTITPAGARDLYRLLYATLDDDGLNPVEKAYDVTREGESVFGDGSELRFYVSAVLAHQTSRYDVVGETLNGKLFYPRHLARAHNRVVKTEPFLDGEWTAPLPTNENWALLSGSDEQLGSVTNGWYFTQTFAEHDDDEAEEDDPRIDALVAVLSGESIAVEQLLGEYTDRITTEANDEDRDFPSFLVASQFAQLCALADGELGLLSTDDDTKRPITRDPAYEKPPMEPVEDILADGGNPGETKLESFIQQTPAIAPTDDEDDTTDQRRGAFLLGALVGAVGNYQGYDLGRSTTLIDQFPVKSITQTRIKKVTQETIGKTVTYTREEGRTVTKFSHIVERLRETVLNPEPDEWVLDTDDLRFYYALGVTYGMNDRATSNNEDN